MARKKQNKPTASLIPGTDVELLDARMSALLEPVDSLAVDPDNPRKPKNNAALARMFRRFGYSDPIIVNAETRTIEAGHQRLAAIVSLGGTQIPVLWSQHGQLDARAYNIAHNRSNEIAADWDEDALVRLLTDLRAEDGVDAIGWDGDELDRLLASGGPKEPPPDPPVPQMPENPVTRRGDVWGLGDHRIMCGDCRDADDFARLTGDDSITVAFTSPPYASRRKYDESSGFQPIAPDDYVDWWEPLQKNVAGKLLDRGSFFVNIKSHCEDGDRHLYVNDLVTAHARSWGWRFVDEFCWERVGLPGRFVGRFKNAWEPVFHFARGKSLTFNPESVGSASDKIQEYKAESNLSTKGGNEGYTRSDMNERGRLKVVRSGIALPSNRLPPFRTETTEHSAAFPVGLPRFFIKAFSDVGDTVLDPFMGSGSTLIAAEQEGRRALGMEISPGYCDMIVERWEVMTGRKAELCSTL